MEYYAGGDFLTLLSKHDDRLSEGMARFYLVRDGAILSLFLFVLTVIA